MTPTLEKEIIKLPSDQDISGRTFGAEEIAAVTEVLQSGVLITTKGKYGKLLEQSFAEKLGVKYAYACNSGSAAVHVAVAAINPNPGDEIVTSGVFRLRNGAAVVVNNKVQPGNKRAPKPEDS